MNALDQVIGDLYAIYQGDSVELVQGIPDNAIHLTVSSPPFIALYAYTASDRDMGNSATDGEFFRHFDFLIGELLRITMPGRIAAIHVIDVPAMLVRDGWIGLKDFSGDVIRAFVAKGWIWDARVPIDKNQQAQSIRTHSKALTMTQLEKDRSWLRPALPDYILKFRKPGANAVPVKDGLTRDEWIEWANPTWPGEGPDRCADAGAHATWYSIRETDTLNVAEARGLEDERHICPLQLGTIKRCIRLWSNEGEIVLDPFAGIGSVPYQAIRLRRHAIGMELKAEYFKAAARNLARAEAAFHAPTLFQMDGEESL